MTNADLRRRGFNLAHLLARWWFSRVERPIIKTRQTPPQADLSREERMHNLRRAFAPAADPANEVAALDRWILVDDVVTTGTTVRRASSALRRAGAESIHVLALARA